MIKPTYVALAVWPTCGALIFLQWARYIDNPLNAEIRVCLLMFYAMWLEYRLHRKARLVAPEAHA